MDGPQRQAHLAELLIKELNGLLIFLSLPFTLTTLYDLTPSLLLAILESILLTRLPISDAIRESRTPAAKVEAMKILLGMLEDDILHTDIGLSEIDPRRLATGEWDELMIVGETLCWIARHKGILRSPQEPTWDRENSSTTDLKRNGSMYAGFSLSSVLESSVMSMPLDLHPPHQDVPHTLTLKLGFTPRVPRCIHEVEMSSSSIYSQSDELDDSPAFCDCSQLQTSERKQATWHDSSSSDSARPSVRYEGLIEPADDDVLAFEALRERSRTQTTSQIPRHKNTSPQHWKGAASSFSEDISSPYYTLSLLQERARLLGELAKVQAENRRIP